VYILYFIYGKYWSNLFSIFDDVILVYFSCVHIHTCTWAFILRTSFWWLLIMFMSKGNYGYYQKVHEILLMPSSIMFMLKCNSIYYHREHKKRLLPISNYDFTLMLISDLIKIYVKVGSPTTSNQFICMYIVWNIISIRKIQYFEIQVILIICSNFQFLITYLIC